MTKKQKNNKRVKKYFAICLVLIIIGIVAFLNTGKVENIQKSIEEKHQQAMEQEEINKVGQNGIVTEAVITGRKTGTGPFDDDNEPGNDSSADNNIVRSFDQISWTIENTMNLKNPELGESYKGGVLQVKAEIPENLMNVEGSPKVVEWDLNSMGWVEDGNVSADGRIFTGKYTLSETEVTVPGKQTLVFVLKVLGAPNGMEITPTFTVSLQGNDEQEKYELTDSVIKVSAAPKINVQLKRNDKMNYRSYFDDQAKDEVESKTDTSTYGRMQGYGITLQLYNSKANKKLKGIEIPKGDITFDLTFNELIGTTDVTNEENYTPKMWEYKENSNSVKGKNQKNMMWNGSNDTVGARNIAPFNSGGGRNSCYNGGTWEIIQDDENANIYHVKVKEYLFAPQFSFPTNNLGESETTDEKYGENIGCFSAGYVQTILQMPEEVGETKSIYMKATASNLNFKTISDRESGNDEYSNDNMVNTNITLYPTGTISTYQHWHSNSTGINSSNVSNLSSNHGGGGDSYYTKGSIVVVASQLSIGSSNDEPVKRANLLQKFDDKAFEPLSDANNNSGILIRTANLESKLGKLNTLYAAKPDKTGWTDNDEMQDTREEDLIYFTSYQELKNEGYICVGVLYENTEIIGYNSTIYYYGTRLNIKDTANVGEVYQTVNDARAWINNIDFSWQNQQYTYDETNGLEYIDLNYPNPYFEEYNGIKSGVKRYIKTAYDENGQIVNGTHYGGYRSGNSLLIVGANLKVNKTVTDKNTDGSKKTNYDLGKNEFDVNYQITPSIVNSELTNGATITGVNLKITDTLPKGLKYIAGSSNSGEPEITENADGTTTLVWYKYNCTVNEDIDAITYTAHINEETSNGTQFENTTKIEEIVANGENFKIGNSREMDRVSTSTIQVVNLSGYALFKTTETPVIENNQKAKFTVTAMNKTDEDANAFQLLDILPYNGDSRGSNFNGNYSVEKIIVKQIDSITGEEITNNNLKLYVTADEQVRTGITAKDTNLGTTSIWTEKNSEEDINELLTAYAIIGKLPARTKLEIGIILKTDGNKPLDVYQNIASAQINVGTEEIVSPIVKVQVVKRTLDGRIWFDRNKDGLMDSEEDYLSGVKVTLVNEDGTKAKDIDGNEIEEITTTSDGYYKFEDMVRGKYKVKIEYDTEGGTREVTTKNAGSNIEINSKFNSNGETDIIKGLDSISSPELKVEHENAGIAYKDAKVTVHHYIEGTTDEVPLKAGGTASDETIEGKVNDTYTTSAVEVPDYYELIGTPTNASGEMTKDEIIVVYYYKIKKYPYTVKYIDKDTNKEIKTAKNGESKDYGTEITVDSEKVEINKYTYDLADIAGDTSKTKLIIGTELDKNAINLYYTKKKGKVTVKYVDKITGNEIIVNNTSLKENMTEKVDESYTTTKKDIDGYTYVEDTGNTTGTYTLESNTTPIEVIYYYKKNTKVITKHLDKLTGEEIPQTNGSSSRETKEGLEGDSYITTPKNFENYVLVEDELPTNQEGTMTSNEITVIYYYNHISGGVIEKHMDDITGEILYNETHTGNEGDIYDIKSKPQNEDSQDIKDKFDGYELVSDKNPTNSTGTMTKNLIEVIYYYRYPTKVISKYVDKITDEEITEKVTKNGYKGEEYTTENKTFENYDLVEVPENKEGIMKKDEITVTYYYKRKSAGVTVNYYDVDTEEKLKEEQKIEGHQGDDYNTAKEDFEGYDVVKEKLPQKTTGKMTIEEIKIDYYYKKKVKVKVEHKDKTTGRIMDIEEIKGHRNDKYETKPKEYTGYDLVEIPENDKGTMTDEITVTYYYIKKAEVETLYVEDGTEKELTSREMKNGHIGDKYETFAKKIENYTFVNKTDNATGEMGDKKIIVKYYYKPKEFNLKIEKWIDSVRVEDKNKKGQKYKERDNLFKLEIYKNIIKTAEVKVTYKIRVTNTGEIIGFANEIKEKIPQEFEFKQSDNNIKWKVNGRNLTTTELEKEAIEPGKYKEIEITLRWKKGDSNLGNIKNTVKLNKTSNSANFKEQTEEDNKSESKMIITVSTGLTVFKELQTKIIIVAIVVLTLVGAIIIKKRKN